jgi:hypothetical protein
MTPTPPSDFSISFSEAEWLRFMTSEKRRPNVLVTCSNSGVGPVVARLTSVCARPLHSRHLPGPLNLQEVTSGTLLISDVAHLTPDQQMELHEWMGGRRPEVQIVSVTSGLADLVELGQFYEGLFYRLNVITLRAVMGEGRGMTRPEIRPPYRALPSRLDCTTPVRQAVGV